MKANSKEGANLAEFEELLKNETVSGITTKEQAIDWMVKNPNTAFKSALDYREQQASEARERNFKEKNLPELINAEREKFQKELNPDLTPEQKRIAELERKWLDGENKAKLNDLKDSLRKKAKELGYPESRAEKFAVYGESAFDELQEASEFLNNTTKTKLESEIKTRFGNIKTPETGKTDPAKSIPRADFDAMEPKAKAEFVKGGGRPQD